MTIKEVYEFLTETYDDYDLAGLIYFRHKFEQELHELLETDLDVIHNAVEVITFELSPLEFWIATKKYRIA